MKMAKASEADLAMAIELANALESLTDRWGPTMPEAIDHGGEDSAERFDLFDEEHCRRALDYLLQLARRASLSRVVFGMSVLLDPRNELVDPEADTLELHPKFDAAEKDAVMEWQPIETAPKDGTEILVHTRYGNFYVVGYDDVFSAPWRVRNDEGLTETAPTHWMPLPPPPIKSPE